MRSASAIRLIAGVVLLLTGASALMAFDLWQAKLAGLSPDGAVQPLSWLTLRIMLLSLFAPGVLLLMWEPSHKLIVRTQQYLDRLSGRTFLIGVLTVAAAMRIMVVVIMPLRLLTDWATYHELAVLWVTTGEYTDGHYPTGYFPPGWPFFLSRLYLIFGENPQAGVIANIILGLGIVYLGYRLIHRIWGTTPARWTAIILAIFPSQVLATNMLCSEILFTFLFLLSLDIVLRQSLNQREALGRSFMSGLLLGLATLVRSITLVFPLVILPFFLRQPTGNKVAVFRWLALVIGLSLVTVPWIVRNYNRVGRATISTNGGVNFYIGNNLRSGAGYSQPDPAIFPMLTAADEAHDDRLGYKLGWEYICQKPVAFFKRGVVKVAFMMASDSRELDYELMVSASAARFAFLALFAMLAQSFYFIFIVFAAWGIGKSITLQNLRKAGGYLFLLIILYWLAVHFVFFGDGRFHFPIVPLLAGFAGLAIAGIARGRGHIITQ